jgi:hypothetical protein
VQLAWDPPTADAEGMIPANLAGYRVHLGVDDGQDTGDLQTVIDVGAQTTYTVADLEPGETYTFAVTAYDSAGHETELSNIVTYNVPRPDAEVIEAGEGEEDVSAELPAPIDDATGAPDDADLQVSNEEGVPEQEAVDELALLREPWRNYRISLTLGSENYDDIGIMFRYQNHDNYYRFSWGNRHTRRSLEKRQNGVFTLLAEDVLGAAPQNPYQLTVVAEDEALEVWINATLVFSVRDTTFLDGPMALYALGNGGNHFDNVLVEDLETNSLLVCDNFDDARLEDWMIVDEGVMKGASEWATENGMLVQRADIDADMAVPQSLVSLGTYALTRL